MSIDIPQWRRVVVDQVASLADEAAQRNAWFQRGPWSTGPRDDIDLFFGHAAVRDFLARDDNGLNERQVASLSGLVAMLEALSQNPVETLRPELMVDAPAWQAVRRQAALTLEALSAVTA